MTGVAVSKVFDETSKLRREIHELKEQCALKEQRLGELEQQQKYESLTLSGGSLLSSYDIERYSRQLILPNFGVKGQLKLVWEAWNVHVPSICLLPVAALLGLVDYDEVVRSNFHRLALHTELSIVMAKVSSAKDCLEKINPHCQIDCHCLLLKSENALDIVGQYDIIRDCTDVATRYLLNDACVMLGKPLVSGQFANRWPIECL